MALKITEKECKTALSYSGIYGWNYTINPYRGCLHGCKYCYAPNILRVPRASWGTYVEVKKNIPKILSKELKRHTPGLVGMSSVTDPYQKLEEKFKLTRYCLEQLLRFNFPVSIITKSPLILRDIDILKKFQYSEITISISTMDEQLSNILEPNAPKLTERIDALTLLNDEGLNTYAFFGPLLPTLELDQVTELIQKISQTGVKSVMVDSLNLKPGIWPQLKNALEEYPEIRKNFYNRLQVDRDYYPKVFSLIKDKVEAKGLKFE